jgi:tetratricopeptide (TPR) repeat protein
MTHTPTTIPARKRLLSEIQRQSKTPAVVVRHSERANVGRAHCDRAKVCASQGDVRDAVLAYEAAVRFAPDFAEAHSNLGNLYFQSGRRDDALRAYAAAIRAKPDLAPVYCNLATVLIDLGRCDEAVAASETALRLAPDLYEAHVNLYQAYRRCGRHREALAPARRAAELRPNPQAYVNLGVAACNLDTFDVAIDANRRALELDATCADAHCNLGLLYHLTGRHAEAIAASETAIALRPDFAQAHVNLAHSLLVCGDFARGWDEFVWTWRLPDRRVDPHLDRVKLWNGEPFAGRSLLIALDQGAGDAFQMVRFLPAVKARGGRVILEVKPVLVQLFADLPGVDVAAVGAIPAEEVDLQISILGLPSALATDLTSIPAPIPYLRAQPERVERWRSRLDSPARLRVGIVWAGNPDHGNDRRRSCGLEDFAALGAIRDIAWFGLQKGRDQERRSCGSFTLDPLGAEIGDFADTAAILTHLDLVIAIDTAIVHLAGAMGKPVWTLLAFATDWRWLLRRDDSPWYPTMRLFRQPAAGDWAAVFADVARELRAL